MSDVPDWWKNAKKWQQREIGDAMAAEVTKLRAENERLQKEYRQLRQHVECDPDECERLRARVAELEASLQRIADNDDPVEAYPGGPIVNQGLGFDGMREVAIEALRQRAARDEAQGEETP